MLRIILIIVISYIVIRIALRLLLTESPAQRRSRMYDRQNGNPYGGTSKYGPGGTSATGGDRFDHIEDAEFEEIPSKSKKESGSSKD